MTEKPYLRALGTAQDGGFPHAACSCERCDLARQRPEHRRDVASLALVLPGEEVFLVDASPDIRRQLDSLEDVRNAPPDRVDRAPVDGVFLTHAHIGHYLGLAFFGFEAVHPKNLPVFCTPRMATFLRDNGPWGQQVSLGNLELREIVPGEATELAGEVRAEFLKVPHRDEYSDTVGFFFQGPRARVLYVPDTDSWRAWPRPLPEVLEGVDVAILDGTFYSAEELPGRAVASIGHPLIADSMDLLQERVEAGTLRVLFTHFNHSNPILNEDATVREEMAQRGFEVLEDGMEIEL